MNWSKVPKFVFPNPLLTLRILKEKESAILLIYNGLFFNGYMVLSTVYPYLLKTYYGYNELEVGLCYLPLGFGSLAAAVGAGRLVDRRFKAVSTVMLRNICTAANNAISMLKSWG